MPHWLPNKEELRRLLFEFWKWLLLAALGGLLMLATALIPSLRAKAVAGGHLVADFLKSTVELRGWKFAFLLVSSAIGLTWLALRVRGFFGPAYVRRFREAEYHGIIWRWNWKRGKVVPGSLCAYCVEHGIELSISGSATEMVQRGNVTSMRNDTDIYCTGCNSGWTITNCSDLHDRVRRVIEADAVTDKWRAARDRVPIALRVR
jgi:hypothetical protein